MTVGSRLSMVGITQAPDATKPPDETVDFVLVLDKSGSMHGDHQRKLLAASE